jgi:hypothetical protein
MQVPERVRSDEQKGWLTPGEDPENRLGLPLITHLASDQFDFWTSPKHLEKRDWKFLLPAAGFTGVLFASDSWLSKQIPEKPDQLKRSKDFSNYATYSLIGMGGSAFVLGHLTDNDHLAETGFLAGEAALDSTAVAYALKALTQRPRPFQDNRNGTFFHGGSSFPSEHSAIAWSVASILAHEYPGTLSQVLSYGLAAGVSVTRVTGQQHFASDVVIGSALGWYFGRQVYRAHHDASLGGAGWGDALPESSRDKSSDPGKMGSSYVPLDSWVYSAFDRLAALGYVHDGFAGQRPWTRMECARLLENIDEELRNRALDDKVAQATYATLEREFSSEAARLDGEPNLGATLDSVYVRTSNISGRPLVDGYHFGQTIINDYGRPYGEGFSSADGFTARAEAGPFAFFVRGEYQHAPAISSDPLAVLQDIAHADVTKPVPNGRPQIDRFQALEGAVSVNLHNLQLSFGKQSLWLGPGESGALLLSNNAEPLLMLKLESASAYRVPLVSNLLGPIRSEYFLGQLAGQQFELNGAQLLGPGNIRPQPFLDGAKVSFKPTPNLEIGVGFTAQFAGPGLAFNFRNFVRTFYVHTQYATTTNGNNPAKRASSADFSYRVPGIRDWLTVYADALAVDEISPIGSTRATANPGIYMPQFPKLHNLELRAEGIHEPLTNEFAPGFVYYGLRRYRSGYTNDRNLLGNWIGRAGRGGQGWLTYSFSPRTQLQGGYRLQEVSHDFLQGGRLTDYSASGNCMLTHKIGLAASLQYEQWHFPVLSPVRQSNITASFQMTFYPGLHANRSTD